MLSIESFVYRNFDPVDIYGNPPSDYRVACPFCEDVKGHMHIAMDKPAVHCFRCGYSSSWLGLVIKMTGYNTSMAIGELYKIPSMVDFNKLIRDKPKPVKESVAQLPKDFAPLYNTSVKDYKPFKNYLFKRGFGPQYWKKYNLGSAMSVEYRVIIPIEFDYWQGRAIHTWMEPKYINPPNPSSIAIFNSKALELYDEVVICEGAFSAMAVGDNAIALVGKESPAEKLERIINSEPIRFIIALEPDAFSTMKKLADALYANGKHVILWKYSKGDPAEVGSSFEEIEYGFKTKLSLLME